MTRRRWVIAVVLVVAIGGSAWFAMMRPVPVAVAARSPATTIDVFGLGTVEARVVSRLGFETAGIVIEMSTDAGQIVERGQLLARLRSEEQQARLAVARAAVTQAKAAVTQAEATQARAQAQARQRLLVSQRRQELLRRGTISDEVAHDALTAYEMASAEADQATSAIAVAVANLEQAQATVMLEVARLEKHSLRAPFDAVVMQRHRELGAAANPGEPIVSLVDPATVWVLAHVDEAVAGPLAIGQTAQIRLRSIPRSAFRGRIVRIDIESDRVTEERRVYLTCDDCPRAFFLGEQAEIVVTVGELRDALLLPRTAIVVERDNTGRAWAVRDGRIVGVDVLLGARLLDGRVEIASPVPEGTALIVSKLAENLVGRRAAIIGKAPP